MVAIAEHRRTLTDESLRLVLTLIGREVRDTLRDWRIVVPIVVLTLLFPALMSFVADMTLNWVAKYGAPIVGERMLPFMLMVVGFFPISFSLVIALETFVGEKERRSLEPLLATPLTDAQLYLGKTLASSQTTSVRAANLLASFIIIPMALLLQGEAIIMFWANYDVLWWIVLFLVVVDVILVRMGIRIFNREELLGHEIDELNVASLWRKFRGYLRWEPWFLGLDLQERPAWLRWLGTVGGLYGRDIPAILRRSRLAIATVVVGLLFSAYIGYAFAARYQLPPEILQLENLSAETFAELPAVDWLPAFTVWGVLTNNMRSLILATLLATFSFGTLAVPLLMAPLSIVFFFVAQAARLGYNPALFFATFVLPHGILELPAATIATALAVRLGAAFTSPSRGMTVGDAWLRALAGCIKVFIALVLPLLALAAAIEVYVTPAIVMWAYGG